MLVHQVTHRPTLGEAYAFCRKLALGRYENFPVVAWMVPRQLRPHLFAVYAYCRGVDDLGDEASGDRLALLGQWERELRACYEAEPTDVRFIALADTIRKFELLPEPFLRLIEANRRDQRVHRYQTFGELLDYCSYSANPVGELVLRLFGYGDETRRRLSDATCTGLQLANFWQDVGRDLVKGRIYIPLEDMQRFGYTQEDLMARRCTPGFRRLMAFEVERTHEYFREGLGLLGMVDGRLRLYLRLFSLAGLAVLNAIERCDYDVLSRRPTLSRWRKARLAVRGLLPLPVKAGR